MLRYYSTKPQSNFTTFQIFGEQIVFSSFVLLFFFYPSLNLGLVCQKGQILQSLSKHVKAYSIEKKKKSPQNLFLHIFKTEMYVTDLENVRF